MIRPEVVEFFGPPGVGKSAIATELYRAYRVDQISASEPTYRLAEQVGRWQSHAYKFHEQWLHC